MMWKVEHLNWSRLSPATPTPFPPLLQATPAAKDCCRPEVHSLGREDGISCHQLSFFSLILFLFSTISAGLVDLDHVMAGEPMHDCIQMLRCFFCFPYLNIRGSIIVDGHTLNDLILQIQRHTYCQQLSPLLFFSINIITRKPRLPCVWASCLATEV